MRNREKKGISKNMKMLREFQMITPNETIFTLYRGPRGRREKGTDSLLKEIIAENLSWERKQTSTSWKCREPITK